MRRDMATLARYPHYLIGQIGDTACVFTQTREQATFAKAGLCIVIRRNELLLHGPRLYSFLSMTGHWVAKVPEARIRDTFWFWTGIPRAEQSGRQYIELQCGTRNLVDRIRANFRALGTFNRN